MLTDAELNQMQADAAEMQRLREKATPGPWRAAGGDEADWYMYDVVCPHQWEDEGAPVRRTLLQLNHNFRDNIPNDREFIAAARSDKSAEHVERLVQEVRRLRQQAAIVSTPRPEEYDVFYYGKWASLHKYLPVIAEHEGKCAIRLCHMHGVPVPEHLKPYESEVK